MLYCLLAPMSLSRTTNNIINKIYEKALRLAYKDETSLSLDDLLKWDKSVIIHQRNLQILATESYKMRNDLGPGNYERCFSLCIETIQSEKWFNTVKAKKLHSVLWNRGHIFPCTQIWEIVPCGIKNTKLLDIFNEKRKLRITDKCHCRV